MHQHRHVIADLIRNPEGQGRVTRAKQAKPTFRFPLSLDGRGIKGEGEINTPAHVTDCTRINHPYTNPNPTDHPFTCLSMLNPMKHSDAAPYLSMPVPHPVDSRLRENDGKWLCCLVVAQHTPPLWIDESLITLYQRARFQRKGVYALSFSS